MYAIVAVGHAQYKVSEGDTIETNQFPAEEGKNITLDKVLMFAHDSDIRVGQPYLPGVKVTAKVLDRHLGPKLVAFKFKKRKDSAKKIGHRQKLISLNITKITA